MPDYSRGTKCVSYIQQPLFPWQQHLLGAVEQGRNLTVDVPRRYGLSLGPRLAHRVQLDLLTGKYTHSFTVIIDDPEAGHRKLDPTARLVAQALASIKQDVDALGRWADDGGRA